nr:glutathion S-transferase 15 [Trametes gibbosa]
MSPSSSASSSRTHSQSTRRTSCPPTRSIAPTSVSGPTTSRNRSSPSSCVLSWHRSRRSSKSTSKTTTTLCAPSQKRSGARTSWGSTSAWWTSRSHRGCSETTSLPRIAATPEMRPGARGKHTQRR